MFCDVSRRFKIHHHLRCNRLTVSEWAAIYIFLTALVAVFVVVVVYLLFLIDASLVLLSSKFPRTSNAQHQNFSRRLCLSFSVFSPSFFYESFCVEWLLHPWDTHRYTPTYLCVCACACLYWALHFAYLRLTSAKWAGRAAHCTAIILTMVTHRQLPECEERTSLFSPSLSIYLSCPYLPLYHSL